MNYQVTEFEYAGLTLAGFKSEDGQYYLIRSQIGEMIGNAPNSFLLWSRAKQITEKYGDIPITKHTLPNGRYIKIVPTSWVVKYLFYWSEFDDRRAMAISENLCEYALNAMIEKALSDNQ